MKDIYDGHSFEGIASIYALGAEAYKGHSYPMEFQDRPDLAMDAFNAYDWIEQNVVVDTKCRLSIPLTQQLLGLEMAFYAIEYDGDRFKGLEKGRLRGTRHDYENSKLRVELRDEQSSDEHKLTFGHELGHLFLEETMDINSSGGLKCVEGFCETFGREVVLPLRALGDIGEVNRRTLDVLMARHDVSLQTVLFQLILAGKLPEKVGILLNIGSKPNPKYSNKDELVTYCMHCELSDLSLDYKSRETAACMAAEFDIPVFDFREHVGIRDSFAAYCRNNKRVVRD